MTEKGNQKKEPLTLAKQYQRAQKWEKAIKCFNQYIKEQENEVIEETVYVNYVKCLRFVGKTTQAAKVLNQGREQHPKSERIHLEFYHLYDFLGEWEFARKTAQTLIKLNPQQGDHYFRLGRSYSFLLKYNRARTAYRIALEHKHGLTFDELVQKIQHGITTAVKEAKPNTSQNIQSEYIFIDGKNNFGALVHQFGDRKYFTKISRYTNKNNGASREELFYKKLNQKFKGDLKGMVPEFVDSQIIDKVSYLTLEMVDAIPQAEHNLAFIEKVISASEQLMENDYRKIFKDKVGKEIYTLPDYVFQFKKGRAISVVHFFTHIHEEAFNVKLFEGVKLIMKQHQYPSAVRQVIQRLKSVIMDNQLYAYIIPEEHYSLLHGDFAFQNVLVTKEGEAPCIIDWTSHTIGPRFIDLARYFTSLLLPYPQIKYLYLESGVEEGKGRLSDIEHIFFQYSLILFYFQKLGRKSIETEISEFLLPVLEDLELVVMKFILQVGKDGGPMERSQEKVTMEELKEQQLKIKQLEQKITILEEERNHLHQRLEDTLNSKSWKLTAPLRLFLQNYRRGTSDK